MSIDIEGWATVAGCLGSIPNPEGVPLAIIRAYLYVATPSALGATLDIGVGVLAADSTDLISAFALNQVAGTLWNGVDLDIASEAAWTVPAIWTAALYLNFTTAAQVSTAFRGTLFVEYLRLT
jgi:hypothetical protein